MSALLEVKNIYLSFGGIMAVAGVSFKVNKGEIFSIIGPNGAGKTSVLNVITGIYKPKRGKILFEDNDITDLPVKKRAKLGLVRTFQNLELFKGMTVLDNLMLSRHIYMNYGLISSIFYFGKALKEEVKNREFVEHVIDFLDLSSVRKKHVFELSYGIQKRVELARALCLEPKLLMLDEPMAGMNTEETEDMARYIIDINEEMGITIILIEHDMNVVMDLSHRVVALDFGEKICEGKPEEVANDERVLSAYLGEEKWV
ncbi:ABC transporter ATP-binding protein [Calditerrivibrio nitroreducens]|uniref:Amino acid/amide ABC transporter ATP-binding protein 1, HAAT family n=1 Tax=Calditerrivibrio nitroreducens (strain DSM 19672 / NBRC 101217 / Yu37-1) TaxID=768670 RepID=E4TGL8_CALNY|nr:ABC transporter ATP-binding protein [Calditerrivibrio nitroreducens]ADR19731.1 amino acid/amide ABC transporter ATP-binding protein 1, HAAT family [Calditerrivibrio nitroreducens DSM 19672]